MAVRGTGPYLAVRWSPKGYLALITPSGGAMLMTRPSPLPAAIWPRVSTTLTLTTGCQLVALKSR